MRREPRQEPASFDRLLPPLAPREELDFLPAAQELVARPAPPLAHVTTWILLLAFAAALLGAAWAEVEVVVTARGRIVPAVGIQPVQPLEAGIVRTLHVREGDRVKAGQVLVELDSQEIAAELVRLDRERLDLRLREAVAEAALVGDVGAFRPPARTSSEDVHLARELLERMLRVHHGELERLARERARLEARLEAIRAELREHERLLPLLRELARSQRTLWDKRLVPRAREIEARRA